MIRAITYAAAALVAGVAVVLPAASVRADNGMNTPPPFRMTGSPFAMSGIAAPGRQVGNVNHFSGATSYGKSPSSGGLTVGSDVNVIGRNDVTQQSTIDGTSVYTCNAGTDTAQNETTIASDGSTLVAGANDYRVYEPSENRYDGAGGYYVSTNGGGSWSTGYLPGLVRPLGGPYESAGDPAVSAGPSGTFWYANLAFDRGDNANSVAASRSTDGGKTWQTSYVIQTSAADGATLFNDKEWIAADPTNSDVAYVTWTQFHTAVSGAYLSSPIVISKTTDGGQTWSTPQVISTSYNKDQGSNVQVGADGTVYVTFEATWAAHDYLALATSTDGGATFTTKLVDPINDIPSPLPGATYRTNSFPAFALTGTALHVVWSNWNGSTADVVYVQSTDGGANWSSPVTISGSGDNFFPWVAASGSKVYASWLSAPGTDDTYNAVGAASTDGGGSWSAPVTLSSATSDASAGNLFGYPNCAASFIGDYSGIAIDSSGVAHALWTDIRFDKLDPKKGGADQDPYTATLSAQ